MSTICDTLCSVIKTQTTLSGHTEVPVFCVDYSRPAGKEGGGVTCIPERKSDNSKEVENMKFSLESVEAQVYKKESEKSSLESQIENLKKNISNLESESSNLQNRLEELKNTKIQ